MKYVVAFLTIAVIAIGAVLAHTVAQKGECFIVNSMVLIPGDAGHDANGNQDGEPITICEDKS